MQLALEPGVNKLRDLGGIGTRAHPVTEASIHQHHGSLGEQTQVRGSRFAGGHVQRERHIDGHAIKARPLNRLGQLEHGHARRMDRIALGMRNGKTGDEASLGLVFASNKSRLYSRRVIGKTKLNSLLGQIMQRVLARGGGVANRHLVGRYKPHGKPSLQRT